MKFFIHKPERKPGIEGIRCVIKTKFGKIIECVHEDGEFITLDGAALYSSHTIDWWCYKDSLISHLESEEE